MKKTLPLIIIGLAILVGLYLAFPRTVDITTQDIGSGVQKTVEIVKEEADLEDRPIRDGEYVPACAENCPADAIYLGDLENKESTVYKLSRGYRAYRVMDALGVEPKVYYLSKRT